MEDENFSIFIYLQVLTLEILQNYIFDTFNLKFIMNDKNHDVQEGLGCLYEYYNFNFVEVFLNPCKKKIQINANE